jgi:hypothetical protein
MASNCHIEISGTIHARYLSALFTLQCKGHDYQHYYTTTQPTTTTSSEIFLKI